MPPDNPSPGAVRAAEAIASYGLLMSRADMAKRIDALAVAPAVRQMDKQNDKCLEEMRLVCEGIRQRFEDERDAEKARADALAAVLLRLADAADAADAAGTSDCCRVNTYNEWCEAIEAARAALKAHGGRE